MVVFALLASHLLLLVIVLLLGDLGVALRFVVPRWPCALPCTGRVERACISLIHFQLHVFLIKILIRGFDRRIKFVLGWHGLRVRLPYWAAQLHG